MMARVDHDWITLHLQAAKNPTPFNSEDLMKWNFY